MPISARFNIKYLTIVVGLFTLACKAEDSDNLFHLSLEQLLDIKVSIASKSEHTTADTPATVSVFSRQQIDRMGIKYLHQLINHIPGFQATRETLRGDGVIIAGRGLSTPQDSHLFLIMINGQRLNDDLTGGAMVTNHFLTLENAEKIEVIRGPGSALYGTSAFVGVINIITLKNINSVKIAVGTNKSKDLSLHGSRSYKQSKIDIFAHYYQDVGENYGPEFTQYRNNSPSVISDPRELLDFHVRYEFEDTLEVNYRLSESKLDGFFTRNIVGHKDDYSRHSQESLSVVYQAINQEKYQVTLGTFYTEAEEDFLVTRFNQTENYTFNNFDQLHTAELKFSAEARFSLGEQHKLTVGFSSRNPKTTTAQRGSNASDPLGELIFSSEQKVHGERRINGVYIQDEFSLSEQLHLTLGLRHDKYDQVSSPTMPRAAMVWQASKKNTFKFLYGKAYRAPSIQETFPILAGNPNLTPETIATWESAWVRHLNKGRFSITYFKSSIKDLINTRLNVGGTSPRIFDNLGNFNTSGLEFEAQVALDNWIVRSTYTHLIKVPEDPRNVAVNTASIDINYHTNQWNINLGGYYHSEMEQQVFNQSDHSTLAGYFVSHSKISYQLDNHSTLYFQANNVINKVYFSPSKRNDYATGLPNRGVEYELGIEMQF